MRYDNIQIETDSNTKVKYIKAPKYPDIPLDNDDFYIITVHGDRMDILAENYYGSSDDYWILAVANQMKGDSLYIQPGFQFRIPANYSKIINDFNTLNGIS